MAQCPPGEAPLRIDPHALLKQAALGKIRTQALPGENIKYAAADIERLAAAGKPIRK
jgi:hypothetical protein